MQINPKQDKFIYSYKSINNKKRLSFIIKTIYTLKIDYSLLFIIFNLEEYILFYPQVYLGAYYKNPEFLVWITLFLRNTGKPSFISNFGALHFVILKLQSMIIKMLSSAVTRQ